MSKREMSMGCPKCRSLGKIIDSRKLEGKHRRRRYKCTKPFCKTRWTTYEVPVETLAALEEAQAKLVALQRLVQP